MNTQAKQAIIEHRRHYLTKMSDVHYHRHRFFNGDRLLIKRYVDNNVNTRKSKFDDFYEDGVWKVVENIGNDLYKIIKDEDESISRIISKIRLKNTRNS